MPAKKSPSQNAAKKPRSRPGRRANLAPAHAPPLRAPAAGSLTAQDALQLQSVIGNRAVGQLLAGEVRRSPAPAVQRKHVLAQDRNEAIERLQARYPKIKLGIGCNTDQESDAFWEKFMKGQTLDQVIAGILDKYGLTDQNVLPITITLTKEPNGVRLQIVVKKDLPASDLWKPGTTLFALNQVFQEAAGKLNVYIESVTATSRGKELFAKSLLPLFESLGVGKLSLTASQIGSGAEGRVAWARYGFIPEQSAWETMREHGKKLVGMKPVADITKEWVPKLKGYLENTSPRTIRQIVYLSWQSKDSDLTGLLNEMLSHAEWKGSLDLTDQRDRAWIASYTNLADASAFSALF